MREISVKYLLSDENEKRLTAVTVAYREQLAKIYPHAEITEDEMFAFIMASGSEVSINEKMSFYEWKFGLRETIS